jgi:pyruvate/2-oxoglutarate dehydrogenase complex dihydrolipoamide acyltransferase (E2) component
MKKEGDSVNADEVVLVVETDKVTVDIKATLSGKIIRRLVESDNVSTSNCGNRLPTCC